MPPRQLIATTRRHVICQSKTYKILVYHYRWLSLPWTLQGIGFFFLITASFELIAAQAPYGTKSMLIGISAIAYLTELPDVILEVIFRSVYSPDKATNPSCGLWLYLVQAVIVIHLHYFV